jgi:hypothetical protein
LQHENPKPRRKRLGMPSTLLTCVARRKQWAWTRMRSLLDTRGCETHRCHPMTCSRC